MNILAIRKAFGGRLIGKPFMEEVVCEAVLRLPPDFRKQITSKVWIISSPEDAWALTFRGEELRDRHLIFLSDELFRESKEQITYTVLHEIGHVVLNHRNSIGYEQTESEIRQQEQQADAFAKQYLLTKV
jgi:hypothetical protein